MFEIRRHVSDHQFKDVHNDNLTCSLNGRTGISCFHSLKGHKMLVYFWNSSSVFSSFVDNIRKEMLNFTVLLILIKITRENHVLRVKEIGHFRVLLCLKTSLSAKLFPAPSPQIRPCPGMCRSCGVIYYKESNFLLARLRGYAYVV